MRTLYLYIADNNLRNLYHEAAYTRNMNIEQNPYSDSGFDLFLPQDYSVVQGVCKIDYEVIGAMYENGLPRAYCIYPRSSIYKTPLRMTNSVGIIDSGYRGELGVYLDGTGHIDQFQRLIQICSPTLDPFFVVFTNTLSNTERNQNGFGSSGR